MPQCVTPDNVVSARIISDIGWEKTYRNSPIAKQNANGYEKKPKIVSLLWPFTSQGSKISPFCENKIISIANYEFTNYNGLARYLLFTRAFLHLKARWPTGPKARWPIAKLARIARYGV